jgi:Tol biopolymer transport system component
VPISIETPSEREVTEGLGHDPAPPNPFGIRAKLIYGSLLAIALLALCLGWFWIRGQRAVPRKVLRELQITHNLSEKTIMGGEISPDGKYVAYADKIGLHLITIQSGESHDIALPEGLRTNVWDVTWFPDGEKLIIQTYNVSEHRVLWLISTLGGTPRKLRSNSWGAKVSPDGSLIAFIGGGFHEIWVAGADGGNAKRILNMGSAECRSLTWSQAGHRLAYVKAVEVGVNSIETLSLDGGSPSLVISDPRIWGSPVWLRDGRLVFPMKEVLEDSSNLWEITADSLTGVPSGKPEKITNWSGTSTYVVTASRDGRLLAVDKSHGWSNLYVGDLKENGTRLVSSKRLTWSDSFDSPVAWTRDSKTILFVSDRMGRIQIFKQELGADTAEPVFTGPDDQISAQFSADAAWILYLSQTEGRKSPPTKRRLMRFPISGGSPEQVLELPMGSMMFPFSCPYKPSSSCVISRWDQGQFIFYVLDPLRGQGKEVIRTNLGLASDLTWSISPDGSRIAISSWSQLREHVRILDLRNDTERDLQLPHGWFISGGCWSADSSALLVNVFTTEPFTARIDLEGKTKILLDQNHARLVAGSLYLSPDGQHLAYSGGRYDSNVWLLENF